SANCSIERPALTWRILDWLRTSLLKGISLEGLRLILSATSDMVLSPLRADRNLSLGLQPVTKKPAPLFLSTIPHRRWQSGAGAAPHTPNLPPCPVGPERPVY